VLGSEQPNAADHHHAGGADCHFSRLRLQGVPAQAGAPYPQGLHARHERRQGCHCK
ncbi:hypothetical protein V5799_007692, partial [Amblyomma americanum]